MFIGYVNLGGTLAAVALTRDASRTPTDLDAVPTFRVYGPDGLVVLASGTGSLLDAGSITDATNASPIVITSAGHGLTTGTLITVSGVGGNSGANGSFTVTAIDADTFSLDGSTGTGAYTSGGAWHASGLYRYEVDATAGNGFELGAAYTVLLQGAMAGVAYADTQVFIVT